MFTVQYNTSLITHILNTLLETKITLSKKGPYPALFLPNFYAICVNKVKYLGPILTATWTSIAAANSGIFGIFSNHTDLICLC